MAEVLLEWSELLSMSGILGECCHGKLSLNPRAAVCGTTRDKSFLFLFFFPYMLFPLPPLSRSGIVSHHSKYRSILNAAS